MNDDAVCPSYFDGVMMGHSDSFKRPREVYVESWIM